MSESDKIVSVYLKFGADQAAIQKSIAEFKKIQVELDALEKDAKSLKGNISTALEHGNDVSALITELKTVEAAISNLKKKADADLGAGLNSSFEKVAQSAQRTGASVGQSFNLRDIGEKLNFVGQAMSSAGQGMTNTLMGAVNAYMTTSGQYSQEAQKWNAAQKEISDAYARIGAVAIDKLTPYLETAADLLSKLADFIEQNPQLVGIIAGTGAALTLGGQFVSGLAQLAMIAGSINGLTAILGGGTAAAGGAGLGAMAIAAAPYVVAALLGIGAIALFTNYLNEYKQQNGTDPSKNQTNGPGVPYWMRTGYKGAIPGGTYTPIEGNAPAKRVIDPLVSANLDAYIELEKQKAAAASQYGEQVKQIEDDAAKRRLEIIQNFADRAVQAESSYQRETASAKKAFDKTNSDATKAFSQANTQALNEYNKQRTDATAKFNLDEKRTKQDHQQEMLRLEGDHNGRVKDLVASRDALGLNKENESYAKQRDSAESDFSLASERRKQDFQQQLSDMASNYQEQRSQRAQEYAAQSAERINVFVAQQAERAQAHAQEMATLQKEKTDQLNLLTVSTNDQLLRLRDAYLKQSNMMQTAFIDRLNSLSKSVMGDTAAFQKNMLAQSAAFEALLKAKGYIPGYGQLGGLVGPPAPTKRASGGPVLDGMPYLVGEQGPELFMSPRDGKIIPAGLTADLLNPRYGRQGGARNMTVKIESSSLTMSEILSEVDRRFDRFERGLAGAFA